jgi:hypothetical protein
MFLQLGLKILRNKGSLRLFEPSQPSDQIDVPNNQCHNRPCSWIANCRPCIPLEEWAWFLCKPKLKYQPRVEQVRSI